MYAFGHSYGLRKQQLALMQQSQLYTACMALGHYSHRWQNGTAVSWLHPLSPPPPTPAPCVLPPGNHDDYWRVLWDNGRITKERLETMHNPIKGATDRADMHRVCQTGTFMSHK